MYLCLSESACLYTCLCLTVYLSPSLPPLYFGPFSLSLSLSSLSLSSLSLSRCVDCVLVYLSVSLALIVWWLVCVSVCLSVSLPRSACPYVSLSVSVCRLPSLPPPSPSPTPSMSVSSLSLAVSIVCWFTFLSDCLVISLCICLCLCLSVCLSRFVMIPASLRKQPAHDCAAEVKP